MPLSELRRLERVEKDADRAKRLRIVILGIEGWTAPAVAMAVGLTHRICQRWVRRYNESGLAGLDDRRAGKRVDRTGAVASLLALVVAFARHLFTII